MGPVELAEWMGGNPFLEILDVFGGGFDRKISRQENRLFTAHNKTEPSLPSWP
ncbi:MAG: hypothetical protein R6U98_23620 [Pirellulaceae bacterium]